MFMEEELMRGIEQYGPWSLQEFVARSGGMMDVLAYLRGERSLEMFKITSFVTADSVNFERRRGLSSPERSEEKANTGSTN